MSNVTGKFIVSLDFELYWGLTDSAPFDKCKPYIKKGCEAIPKLLELFIKHNIHATWGVVGMLFADSKEDLQKYVPEVRPEYVRDAVFPYDYYETADYSKDNNVAHFAPDLINLIMKTKDQEIGSHTFSHYYCKELGHSINTFEHDIKAARKIAKDKFGFDLTSIIFPRNYVNKEYFECLKQNGFKELRGNPEGYAYNRGTMLARILRMLDTYFNVLGDKTYDEKTCLQDGYVDIKASIFFRKYNHKLRFFEPLKMRCIKKQMTRAAKKGRVFHLWWHPHNMGHNPEIFLNQIEELLIHFDSLKKKYGFESLSMGELAEEVLNG